MNIICSKPFSIAVTNPACNTLTPADWLTNPGSCRLRVKNYNSADWIGAGCVTCPNAGGTTWDGTFPLFVPGPNPSYQIDPTTGNVAGKAPLFGLNCSVGAFAGFWSVALACNPRYIWVGSFFPTAVVPMQIYTLNLGPAPCNVTLAALEIEAYIP
jgi:hypothetical protein